MTWDVHKFGGTSLRDAGRIAAAGGLVVEAREGRVAVVVSAMAGVTNELIALTETAARRETGYAADLEQLAARVLATCGELLGGPEPVAAAIREGAGQLRELLRGVELAGVCPPSTLDLVSGFGELWSARMLAAWLTEAGHEATWLDARDVLVVEHEATGTAVLWEPSGERFERWLADHPEPFVVITGFVARDRHGTATTLRRNGSDYTASIFGRLLDARAITIWTDVDGVMSADPRLVPEADVVPALSYTEAIELAFFGAEVLHPQTMGPAVQRGIPIRIRNASNVEAPGTWIRAAVPATEHDRRGAVRGLSSVGRVALLDLEGTGMIGVPGIASRLFTALHEVGISVTMISQASSEHSICVAIPFDRRDEARAAVERAFVLELEHGRVQRVEVSGPFSILAAVGDEMVETSGVAARLFGALGRAGVNVRAIAQGSSERNISVVVDEADTARALRSTHAGFYLAERTVSVGLVGPGLVGAELLRQLDLQREELRATQGIDLRVRAVANSRRMLLDDPGLAGKAWRDELNRHGVDLDLDALAEHVRAPHLPHAVLIDCSASAAVAARYAGWLERGIHVITPNKQAGAGPLPAYRRLRVLGDRLSTRYLYEATVGAGLPVISTLRDLLRTGDRVVRIEGILSGTLSYLLGSFSADHPFSAAVAEAADLGFLEPDPRDDLAGVDVARKAVILAREIGLDAELERVPTESLVPAELADCDDRTRFLKELPRFDNAMEERRRGAADAGRVLQYGAVIETTGDVAVGLHTYATDHPFAGLPPGDNVIAFTTERYAQRPLIVQGPGAGPAVTAAGVFGDLLRLVTSLGKEL